MTKIIDGIEYSTFLIQWKEFTRKLVRPSKTHGLSRTRIYEIWKGLRQRCNNPNALKYEFYGGRGIKVCPEWEEPKQGFMNFYNWAIANGYKEDLTIDRIDSNKDYCPENCQWLPLRENVRKSAIKPRRPEWQYIAYNPNTNIILVFYKITHFTRYSGINSRRVSDGCKRNGQLFYGWYFGRNPIENSINIDNITQNNNIIRGQETIPYGSTLGVELPAEVQIILIQDKDIVHSA